MEKLILADGTEIEVQAGARLQAVVTMVEDYIGLAALAGDLTEKNLSSVKFVENDTINAEYKNLIMTLPNFYVTQKPDCLEITFRLRERTKEEEQQEDVRTVLTYLTDEQALSVKDLYEEWVPNKDYKTGDRKLYNGVLNKCLQDHTAQAEWNPENAPSLWAKILIPDPEVIPEWEQPDSTNGYSAGDKVTHNGKTWESLVDNNVWEPGVVGTESLWREVMAEEA